MSKAKKFRYLLGAVVLNFIILGVAPGLVSDYVKQNFLVSLIVITVLLGAFLLLTLLNWFEGILFEKRLRSSLVVLAGETPEPRRGLIALMSPGSRTTAAENAVKAHLANLEHCWVISGPDRPGHNPTSRENANALAEKYQNAKKPPITFHVKDLRDEDDPQNTYYLVRSIYEEAKAIGLSERDVISDYTGGTKSMTAGMVLACSTSQERGTEYMKAREVTSSGTASLSTEAVPVMIDFKFGSQL